MEHKKAAKAVELEQQVEQAVEEIERILEEEDFKETVAPAVESEEEPKKAPKKREKAPKKEPKEEIKKEPEKTVEQPKSIPADRIVTVKDLADELGTQPKALRKWLRMNAKRTSGRWEWEAGSPELDEIRAKYHREHEE